MKVFKSLFKNGRFGKNSMFWSVVSIGGLIFMACYAIFSKSEFDPEWTRAAVVAFCASVIGIIVIGTVLNHKGKQM